MGANVGEICNLALATLASRNHTQHGIQNCVEVLAEVVGEEAEDEVSVCLQEHVFAAVAAVGFSGEVLRAIEFDDDPRFGVEEVHFHFADAVEQDGGLR